jgi:hypothetical protein
LSPDRNNTAIHQSGDFEGLIPLARQHQSTQCPNSKSDLIRQADHLDCLDYGALIVAKGVAITSQANQRPTALPLSPGAVTIFSPRRLHIRCQGPEISAQFNSLRDAVLLFTAGLDWALELRGILSRVRPEGATMPGRSEGFPPLLRSRVKRGHDSGWEEFVTWQRLPPFRVQAGREHRPGSRT